MKMLTDTKKDKIGLHDFKRILHDVKCIFKLKYCTRRKMNAISCLTICIVKYLPSFICWLLIATYSSNFLPAWCGVTLF